MINIDIYTLIDSIDDSLLKLNESITGDGYHFIKLSLFEFEEKFITFFGVSKIYNKSKLRHKGVEVCSVEFANILRNSKYINYFSKAISSNYIILLKKCTSITELSGNDEINTSLELHKMKDYAISLIDKLRLTKYCEIQYLVSFSHILETNHVNCQISNSKNCFNNFNHFSLLDEEIDIFNRINKIFNLNNKLLNLAIESFNISYDIRNKTIQYATLMISLESILNQNPVQIAHTISRHTSIICSSTKEEFLANYKKMKKLYNFRNEIMHGLGSKKLDNSIIELHKFVSGVIIYVMENNIESRDILFNELNYRGY